MIILTAGENTNVMLIKRGHKWTGCTGLHSYHPVIKQIAIKLTIRGETKKMGILGKLEEIRKNGNSPKAPSSSAFFFPNSYQ